MRTIRQLTTIAMANRRRGKSLRRAAGLWLRKAFAVCALLGFLAATVGVPVYPVARSTDSSIPHPCAGRGCGCDLRGDCWKSCCCFSLAQRVAWARRHHQPVPKRARARLAAEQRIPVAVKACCAKTARDKASAESDARPASRRVTWQTGIAALKCRGLSMSLSSLGVPITLPPAAVALAHEMPYSGTVVQRAPLLISVVHDLPTGYG